MVAEGMAVLAEGMAVLAEGMVVVAEGMEKANGKVVAAVEVEGDVTAGGPRSP